MTEAVARNVTLVEGGDAALAAARATALAERLAGISDADLLAARI
jgi:hypothetical protein